MSKASQRRLAESQRREKTKRQSLTPHEHLEALVAGMAFKTPVAGKWRTLCQQVNPDPPHPDRAELVSLLELWVRSMLPVLRAVRFIARDLTKSSSGLDGVCIRQSLAEQFGARLLVSNQATGQFTLSKFDLVEEVLRKPSTIEDHSALATVLTDKLTELREKSIAAQALGCLFLQFDPGLPAIFTGVTYTGAMVTLVQQDEGDPFVSGSVAVGQFALDLSGLMVFPPFNDPTLNLNYLQELSDSLHVTGGANHVDPTSAARRTLSDILVRNSSFQIDLQTALSREIESLQSKVDVAEKRAESLLDHLATMTKKAEEKARMGSEKRVRELEARVASLINGRTSATAPAPAQPAAPIADAPLAPLANKMGVFFGQG